ncbi:RecF/RecN/SMC [Syncephalis pseudoplumigaleata]|uniref:Structural maintenance of chromosomes protein n=1 Tax=Syncephalis pseudoplumigaleata TaxID=1712513 RepID=A0A4P9Z566_9FUNG|nr:RecF/RecN/SMC [Syncephalis pseudoplumigaleata]|eukprot:RKP27676.1 RecF/RecN/SMC [Syncephalis pseudoplumigaleata]
MSLGTERRVLDHGDLDIGHRFRLTDRLRAFFEANDTAIAIGLPDVERTLHEYRAYYADMARAKDNTLSYAFFVDIYCNCEISEDRLKELLAREEKATVCAIPTDYAGVLQCLYARLRHVYRSEVHTWWYVFWDDLYRRNRQVIHQFRKRFADFSPHSPKSICYRPMPRAELEKFIAGNERGGYRHGKGIASFLHAGIINRLYARLDAIVAADADVGLACGTDAGTSQQPSRMSMPRAGSSYLKAAMMATDDESYRRLIITKLVADNFKSYAGVQEIGPFHKSFSAVVGPNGSGKSNVIDSLLFVFGYRASKMRQGKLSDLIHASAGCEHLSYCTVEVHFCEIIDKPGSDDYEAIPGSEIVVSRTAYRNNTSKYHVNGSLSSYSEVTSMLRGRGIDLDHKRFLILQGEVESIAQMKAKAQNEHEDGLLEYLEDIIGTSKYKLPLEERNKQLEEINDVRNERLNRVMITEKEKNSLESKKDEALEYIRAENDLTIKKSSLYQRHAYECQQQAELAESTLIELKTAIEAEEEASKQAREEIEALEKAYKETAKEYEVIDKEAKKVIDELAKFEREDVQMQENRKHLLNRQKKDSNLISEARNWIENHNADIQKCEQTAAQLEQSLAAEEAELDTIINQMKGKTEKFAQQIEVKQRELEPWTEQISALQSASSVEEAEYALLNNELETELRVIEKAQETLAGLRESVQAKTAELQEMQELREQASGRLAALREEMAESRGHEEQAKAKVARLRQQTDEARSALRSTQSRGAIIDSLMRLKDSGRLRGIYGRLGSLGAIDPQYDVAISTACPQLENLVVDTVETGQGCISHLRRNKLGRAVFIVLDKLPSMDYARIDTPDGVPRLFDLVQIKDPRLAPAFYSVLRDTLVARDLEQAKRIAFGAKRWRVVTLDGQLIDMAGTMSGGGGRPSRGRMGATLTDEGVSQDAVSVLEQQQAAAEQEWRAVMAHRKQQQQEYDQATKQLPELETLISKTDMDLAAYQKRIPMAEKQIADLKKQAKPKKDTETRMKQLQKSMAKRSAEMEQLKQQTSVIEQDIKALQEKIMEVGGVRLRSQKAKVENIKEQMESCNEQAVRAQVARTKAEKDLQKAEAAVAANTAEVERIAEEIASIESEIASKTEEALEVRQRCDEARAVERKNKITDAQRVHTESQQHLAHWQGKLAQLKLHDDIMDDEMVAELPQHTEDELRAIRKEELTAEIQQLEKQLHDAKPNLAVLEQYREQHSEYLRRVQELDEVTGRRDQMKQEYDDLRKRRLDEFMKGFTEISYKVKEMYQMITLGGNAELELVDSLDPFSEGIVFSVMPPRKSWKNISNLSGGEKTLSSLALVFALHHFKPTPLYVMDEIDAALDFKNVSIVANYIKERTKNAQFIIISLRNNMFELADRLVGIYKTDNKTKSITINPSLMMSAQ